MKKDKAKSELGRQLAKLRHLSLTPERRRQIASDAGKKSGVSRRKKKALTKGKEVSQNIKVKNVA